jgi:hypothetical protein
MSEILEYAKGQKSTKQKIREELVELNKQNVATQAKKAEELTANLVVYNEAIKMMGDETFDLGVENEALRGKIGEVDEKWLSESKNRIKLSYNDAKKNKFILERMRRQTQKIESDMNATRPNIIYF